MAYLPPNEENKNAPAGQTSAAPAAQIPPTTGGSAGAAAGGPKAGAAPGVGTPTQFGSSASKLGDYLSANAPGIQQQAGQIAGSLQNQYGALQSEIGQGVNQFGQTVKQGYTGFDQAAIDKAIQNAMGGKVGQEDVNAIQSRLNNYYKGPAAFEQTDPYTNIQSDVQKATQNANLLTTTPGIADYYKQNFGATSGLAGLDTTLLANTPEALAQIQAAVKPYSSLGDYLQQQTAQANQFIPAAQKEIEQGKQYATQKLTGTEQSLQDQINQALQQRQTAASTQNQQILEGLKARNISAQGLSALGLSQDQWNALNQAAQEANTAKTFQGGPNAQVQSGVTNIDLAQFLQQQNPNTAITAAGVATPQQLAEAQALQQLAANQWTGNPLAGATQVGNAPTGLSTFDYQSALQRAQVTRDQQYAAAQAYASALQQGMDSEHAMLQAQNAANNVKTAALATGATLGAVGTAIGGPVLGATATLGGAILGGGAYNMGQGAVEANKAAYSNPSVKTIGEAINATIGPKSIANAAQGAVQGVQAAVQTIGNMFCFEGHTEVEMADGSKREIKKLELGDLTKGGEVLGTIQAYSEDLYSYDGVEVSGKHAVKENGKWVRVENSMAKRFKQTGKFKVYCLITSKHRIFVNGIEFADYVETDNFENLTIEQSLDALNVA